MIGLKDVAKRAGVSARTVSRVMRGEMNVAPETRDRIKQLCAEMGYRPNLAARGLRAKRAHEVVLIAWSSAIFNDSAEIYLRRIEGMENRLREQGLPLRVRIEPLHQTDAEFSLMLEDIAQAQPVAVAAFPMTRERLAEAVGTFAAADVPLVVIDQTRGDDAPGLYRVTIDRSHGIQQAIHHLARTGRQRIAYAGIETSTRMDGYRAAIKSLGREEIGLFFPVVHTSPEIFLQGRRAADRIAAMESPPDAVQTYGDAFALGLIDRAKEIGMRIPEDLAVVGFDDRNSALLVYPQLTTVALPNLALGQAAADALLAALNGRFADLPASTTLPATLVVRGSA